MNYFHCLINKKGIIKKIIIFFVSFFVFNSNHPMDKRNFFASIFTFPILNYAEKTLVVYDEHTILAHYHQLKRLMPIPQSYKDMLSNSGIDKDSINFYTARYMKTFIEKVGNNIILNNPDFFNLMSEKEQVITIGCEFKWQQVLPLFYKSCDNTP